MKLLWSEAAWEGYCFWQTHDRKMLKRINDLIKDIQRDAYCGIGKPERLKGNFTGLWSRRIDEFNRIVYRVHDNSIEILACKNHYN